jgi:hypothetical protein
MTNGEFLSAASTTNIEELRHEKQLWLVTCPRSTFELWNHFSVVF